MDAAEFRKRGKEMIDYVADYLENIKDRTPCSQVKPGYLQQLIPDEAPTEPEKWDDVFRDIERVIMPGVTHWHSPHFHAYFPTGNSYPAICADILSDAIGCIGFSWISSPACTELEIAVMDWLGKLIKLPKEFLSGGNGGGVIQGTASEATYVALLAARSKSLKQLKEERPGVDEGVFLTKMVIYCSDQAHSSVERAALLAFIRCHKVESDEKECMKSMALRKAIQEDRADGLIPILCVATLGTTPTCSFDNLLEIGPICNQENIWLHIDAAYAGCAFICPEFRPLLDGVQFADSFNFNPHKWLLVNFDCSAMWLKDSKYVVETFNVDPLYLKHSNQDKMQDLRHWQIPLGRRFRSLKLWFVMRLYGLSGLQSHIRKHVQLAKEFEKLVLADSRFQVTHEVKLGLVCFSLRDDNLKNKTLLERINSDGRIHMVPSESKGVFFIRFCVCSSKTELADVNYAWKVIEEVTDEFLKEITN